MPPRHIPTLPVSPIHAFDANVRFRAEAMIDRTASMGALPPVGLPALRLVSGRADQRLSDVVGSSSAARLRHERQSIIHHLGPLANSRSTFFQATKHIHCTSLGEPFALQQPQSNRDSRFFSKGRTGAAVTCLEKATGAAAREALLRERARDWSLREARGLPALRWRQEWDLEHQWLAPPGACPANDP